MGTRWRNAVVVLTGVGVLWVGTPEVRGREAPPIAAGPETSPRRAPLPVDGGEDSTRAPIDAAGPTVATIPTTTPPLPPTCTGGTRLEGEAAKLNGWEVATSPTDYSGTGFASDLSQSGSFTFAFPPLAGGYFEVRTRDITGGSGATRTLATKLDGESIRLEGATWPAHDTWGITRLGAWPLAAGTTELAIGPTPTPAGYLGIDWIEICPVTDPDVQVVVENFRGLDTVAVHFVCAVPTGTESTLLVVPANAQRSFTVAMSSTCAVTVVTSVFNEGNFVVPYMNRVGDSLFRDVPLAYVNPMKLDKYITRNNAVWLIWSPV